MKTKSKPEPKTPPPQWPYRLPNDAVIVTRILDEAERLNGLAHLAATSEKPNPMAAQLCYQSAWAFSLVGAWLRAAREPSSGLPHKPGVTKRVFTVKMRVDDYIEYMHIDASNVTKTSNEVLMADGVLITVPGSIISITP